MSAFLITKYQNRYWSTSSKLCKECFHTGFLFRPSFIYSLSKPHLCCGAQMCFMS